MEKGEKIVAAQFERRCLALFFFVRRRPRWPWLLGLTVGHPRLSLVVKLLATVRLGRSRASAGHPQGGNSGLVSAGRPHVF